MLFIKHRAELPHPFTVMFVYTYGTKVQKNAELIHSTLLHLFTLMTELQIPSLL